METFSYQNHSLGCETTTGRTELSQILKDYDQPVYLYNLKSVEQRLNLLKKSLGSLNYKIHYAIKANANPKILELMHRLGAGIDGVSLGEIKWALENKFSPQDLILSGVGKPRAELNFCIEKNIYQINVESIAELKRLGELAKLQKKECRFGIRLNPDIKVDTHPYISTGFRENKFGIPEQQLDEATKIVKSYSPWLKWQGLSAHIGSQIRELAPLLESARALLRIKKNLEKLDIEISVIDVGGGIGINYLTADESEEIKMIEAYGSALNKIFKNFKGTILLEPGRMLVARSGVLLTQVEYIKNNGFKNFIIVNSGMNHLLRPSLYQAHHRILPVVTTDSKRLKIYDVVGPICESSDVLGYDRRLPSLKEGDWLAIMDAGAYGYSMSSNYNLHEKPTEICV